jgi:uncharacterized protein
MLALNLSRIRTASERFERVFDAGACETADDSFGITAPVALGFEIHKDNDRFRLVGTVDTTLELTCSRCLDPYPWPVHGTFDLMYHPKAVAGEAGEREIGEGDFSAAFYEHEEIDLGQLVREQLYLAVPMKPLCGESCHGLCPVCGTNLNRGACTCRPDWDDPRLAVLRALKRDQ